MNIGIKRKIDSMGRVSLPYEMIKFYHLDEGAVFVKTPEGLLITNPQYKVVKIEKEQ